jgi:farnesyl-diphosphate farnesyltransferase
MTVTGETTAIDNDPFDALTDEQFCRSMLPHVSRTFALTIRLLPPQLGYTVTIAYLLCRIADTIEDTGSIDAPSRVALLMRFRETLMHPHDEAAYLHSAFPAANFSDHRLVRNAAKVLREFRKLPGEERNAILPSVVEMCDGMGDFIALMAGRSPTGQMLETFEELERYCYFVAGTVGHLLTRLFTVHISARNLRGDKSERMWNLSTRFALGLQLTNIVQDVAADAERGVVYVPRELTVAAPPDVIESRHSGVALNALIERALSCLHDAIDYCACVPRNHYRIRLFCLLAPYLAVRTLGTVRKQVMTGHAGIKPRITRSAVYRTLAMTLLVAPSNTLLRAYFGLLAANAAPAGETKTA